MPSRTAQQFTEIAAGYAATMAPSLRPIAVEVVRRAALRPGERVLDLGTGTGTAAAAASGAGRTVIGIDSAPGMLAIGRSEHPELDLREMDFSALAFEDDSFEVLIAVHALLFADDQVATLREWLRVTRPGGRLSLSVPGPTERTPAWMYRDIYARHGIQTTSRYPTPRGLAATVTEAGWEVDDVTEDPAAAIVLAGDDAFRTWREIGFRNPATEHFSAEQHVALTDEMLAATPADAGGTRRIPFGAIYLTARRRAA